MAGPEDRTYPGKKRLPRGPALRPFLGGGMPGMEPARADRKPPAHEADGLFQGVGGDELQRRFQCFAAHYARKAFTGSPDRMAFAC
ncbi:hypothetical protein, partial [Rhodovulum sulfidophilum]|uniref:hypothetical protein n=1 Tax=Rhodovulum sulfidophilum TaxID=35806 RepID=UPI001EE4A5D4